MILRGLLGVRSAWRRKRGVSRLPAPMPSAPPDEERLAPLAWNIYERLLASAEAELPPDPRIIYDVLAVERRMRAEGT